MARDAAAAARGGDISERRGGEFRKGCRHKRPSVTRGDRVVPIACPARSTFRREALGANVEGARARRSSTKRRSLTSRAWLSKREFWTESRSPTKSPAGRPG